MNRRVLLVDDEPLVMRALGRSIAREGCEVLTATSAREALDFIERLGPMDAVISDERMPVMGGLELLARVRAAHPTTPCVLLTAQNDFETAVRAINDVGVFRFLSKPCSRDELLACLRDAFVYRDREVERSRAVARSEPPARIDHGPASERFERALGSLWMAVQPVVSLSRREGFAHEMLVRTDERSVPHPGVLFGLAEELGRLRDLERTVWRLAAQVIEASPGRRFLVNLHPSSLEDVEHLVGECPLAQFASRVVLEVTERAKLSSESAVRDALKMLRARGYQIAVDDLGAGYAGLASLALMEPEVVKLDMSLVRGIDSSPIKARLVGALAALCGELRVTLIAEGVETEAELRTLRSLGCDLFQGYYFARPAKPFPSVNWPAAWGDEGESARLHVAVG